MFCGDSRPPSPDSCSVLTLAEVSLIGLSFPRTHRFCRWLFTVKAAAAKESNICRPRNQRITGQRRGRVLKDSLLHHSLWALADLICNPAAESCRRLAGLPSPVSFAAVSLLRPQVVLISPFALTESGQILPVFKRNIYLCNEKVGRCHCISPHTASSNPSWHFRIYTCSRGTFQECGLLRLTTVAFPDFQRNKRKWIPQGKKKALWHRSSRSNINLAHAQSFASKRLLCLCAPFHPVTVHDVHVT